MIMTRTAPPNLCIVKLDTLRMISRPVAVDAPPNKRRDLSVSDSQLSMRSWTRGLSMTCPCFSHCARKTARLASLGHCAHGPPQYHCALKAPTRTGAAWIPTALRCLSASLNDARSRRSPRNSTRHASRYTPNQRRMKVQLHESDRSLFERRASSTVRTHGPSASPAIRRLDNWRAVCSAM